MLDVFILFSQKTLFQFQCRLYSILKGSFTCQLNRCELESNLCSSRSPWTLYHGPFIQFHKVPQFQRNMLPSSLASPNSSFSAHFYTKRLFFNIWSLIYIFTKPPFLRKKETLVKPLVHDMIGLNIRWRNRQKISHSRKQLNKNQTLVFFTYNGVQSMQSITNINFGISLN